MKPHEIPPHLHNDGDREYVETLADSDFREAVVCTLVRYRRRDTLRVGDAVPDLVLHDLGAPERMRSVPSLCTRPTVFLFGSYT